MFFYTRRFREPERRYRTESLGDTLWLSCPLFFPSSSSKRRFFREKLSLEGQGHFNPPTFEVVFSSRKSREREGKREKEKDRDTMTTVLENKGDERGERRSTEEVWSSRGIIVRRTQRTGYAECEKCNPAGWRSHPQNHCSLTRIALAFLSLINPSCRF